MIFKQSDMATFLFFKWAHFTFCTVGPIRRDILGHFSMLTPFGLEARVKGHIQHLEKFCRP